MVGLMMAVGLRVAFQSDLSGRVELFCVWRAMGVGFLNGPIFVLESSLGF